MSGCSYEFLDYDKWNRRLMNLYWIFLGLSIVTQIVLYFRFYDGDTLGYSSGVYILKYIVRPTALMFFINLLCELALVVFQKRRVSLQPYAITFSCVLLSGVLLSIHYGVTSLSAAFIIAVMFSFVYDNKRILLITFIFSTVVFMAVSFCLLQIESPYLTLHPGDVITTLALLTAAYLVGRLIILRCREIIEMTAKAERNAFESELAKNSAQADAEARVRFMANMSHEIRTPMNAIIGLCELTLYDGRLSDKDTEYLNQIMDSAVGLLDIINDILDISKIDAGSITLKADPFRLEDVLAECETIIVPAARKKGIRAYFYDETTINGCIVGDATRLRQALLNLLSNAVKFTNEGSVTLLIMPSHEAGGYNKANITFEITDTGIGFAKEHMKEIFMPFTQLDESNTRGYGGTGLGLSITKSIVEAMGGHITAAGIPDMGSRFSFSLSFPLAPDTVSEPQPCKPERHPLFAGRVLLCEDNPMGRLVAEESLKKLGLSVATAVNGQVCMDLLSRGGDPFDLIFMDIHMPVMDGLETVRALKKQNIHTPVIALTANVMPRDRETYLEAGMTECLYKPFRLKELWMCVERYLPRRGTASVTMEKPPPGRDAQPVDYACGLERNAESRALLRESLETFVREQPVLLTTLESEIARGDYKAAHRTTHSSKNNAGLVGARMLAESLAVLEESLLYDGSYYKPELLDKCKEELRRAIRYIEKTGVP